MKSDNKLFVAIVIAVFWFLCLPAATNAQDRGVVLVAHGSTSRIWNKKVSDLATRINPNPTSQVKAVKWGICMLQTTRGN